MFSNSMSRILFLICVSFVLLLTSCQEQSNANYTSIDSEAEITPLHLREVVWNYKHHYTQIEKFQKGYFYDSELLPFESFYISVRLYEWKDTLRMAVWGMPYIPAIFEDNLLFYTSQGTDTCFFFCNPGIDSTVIDELTKYNYRIVDNN